MAAAETFDERAGPGRVAAPLAADADHDSCHGRASMDRIASWQCDPFMESSAPRPTHAIVKSV